MKIKKKFLNSEILDLYQGIKDIKIGITNYIPVSINFFIQKNFSILKKLYNEILSAREAILLYYMIEDEQKNKIIPTEKIDIVNNEIEKLLEIEQEIDIFLIPLTAFVNNNVILSTEELCAIMFMIDETDFLKPVSAKLIKEQDEEMVISVDDILDKVSK
jgi:hypothetical protein